MKKVLFIVFIAVTLNSHAQYVKTENGLVDLKSEPIKIIQLLAEGKFMSKKVVISVDFGQDTKKTYDGIGYLIDSKGAKLEFYSAIHAMNYLSSFGWEFVDAHVVTVGNQNVYHYVLKNNAKELKPGDVKPIGK